MKHLEKMKAVVKTLEEPKAIVKNLEEPRAVVNQLTDKDGLDRADAAAHDISVRENTLYIEGFSISKASDLYNNNTKVPTLWNAVHVINRHKSLMCGMKAVPCKRRFNKEGRYNRSLCINGFEDSSVVSSRLR